MNAQVTRLFVLVLVLFGLLVGFTSWWTVVDANELEENAANKRPQLESLRVRRGRIQTRSGQTIARDEASGRGAQQIFRRTYPAGELFGHPVGYSYLEEGQTGVEKAKSDLLVGDKAEFLTLLDELRGRRQEGDDLRTTLDEAAQQTAISRLSGRPGAVVAMEPRTGRVRVMASVPGYDPNAIPQQLAELNRRSSAPLVNRATQGEYPPGSTMKVVTAAAALDSGRFNPSSTVDGSTGQEISGVPLANFGGQDFGTVDLTTALTKSVNTAWANVGVTLGQERMFDYMRRFGFGEAPPLDFPASQLAVSGPRVDGELAGPEDGVDIGRVAIGQGGLLVTPLQMAMVTAAVANDGVLMQPLLAERAVDPDGRTARRFEPDRVRRAISAKAARQLQQMMSRVVQEGTGTAAALEGISVGGKSGTAEIGNANQAWFVAFAPLDKPEIAVAATVERTSGTGGETAAPIVKDVMQRLLR